MQQFEQWADFKGKLWKEEVNVRDFIQHNYTQYEGDESFLAGPTEATNKLWGELQKLQKEERAKGGVLDMETEVVSGRTADRQASEKSIHALRRNQDGRAGLYHLRIYSKPEAA